LLFLAQLLTCEGVNDTESPQEDFAHHIINTITPFSEMQVNLHQRAAAF